MDGNWPDGRDGLPQFEYRTRSFTLKCHALSLRVINLLETRLGTEKGSFDRAVMRTGKLPLTQGL